MARSTRLFDIICRVISSGRRSSSAREACLMSSRAIYRRRHSSARRAARGRRCSAVVRRSERPALMKARSHHKAIDCLLSASFVWVRRTSPTLTDNWNASAMSRIRVVYNDETDTHRGIVARPFRTNQRTKVTCGQPVPLVRPSVRPLQTETDSRRRTQYR